MNASETAWRAQMWRENNPRAWAFMEGLGEADYLAGRRISISRLVELCRAKDFATNDGGRFRISNSYRAAFARMLVKDHPELRGLIVLHKSKLDGLV